MPNAYCGGSGLYGLNVTEATVASLQGSNATRVSASWLILCVAGIVGWAVTQSL